MRTAALIACVAMVCGSVCAAPVSYVDAYQLDASGNRTTPFADGDTVILAGPLDTKGNLEVALQDQFTEVIDLHMSQLIQTMNVVSNAAIDDWSLVVSSSSEPTDNNVICLKESTAFYQGEILSHTASGTNWSITLDTPLDYAYTTNGGCTERNIQMNVDGSSTSVVFSVSPSGLSAGTSWDITRVIFSITDGTAMDDSKFGGIPALTNGIVIRANNGITKNIFNAKSNSDMASHMYDIAYSDKAPAGSFGFRARRTFAGAEKNGVTIRLDADTADTFEIIVSDDLTGLSTFTSIAQGHRVQD